MNSGSNSNIQRTQSGRSTSYKRAHRANRPVLVTKQEEAGALLAESTPLSVEESQPTSEIESAESSSVRTETVAKRGPRFFSSVGKTEKVADQPAADRGAARLARALRGKKGGEAAQEKEPVREKKPAVSPSRASAAPSTRPKSGFKMKYIWGMMIYLLVADFLGVWIANFMQANNLDSIVFTISVFQARRSTLIFLALLVLILIVMARFDLIPRSFGAAMAGSSAPNRGAASHTRTADSSEREAQPTMKQGVRGANDDLYREYRTNQRYFQKRDRKR